MYVYFLMYLIFGIMAFWVFYNSHKSGMEITENMTSNNVANVVCFSTVLILLMFRHPTMGSDLNNEYGYLPFFDYASVTDLKSILNNPYWFETGFKVYIKLLATIWRNHQFFIAFTALLSLIPIAFLIHEKSRKPVMSWIIYTSLMPFVLLFSGLRQGVSIGIGVCLYIIAEKRKPVPFLILTILAMTIHVSSFLLILVYPLVNTKVTMKLRIIGLICLVIFVFIRKPLFSIVTTIFPRYSYLFPEGGGGAYRYFVVLLGIYILCCIFYDGSAFQNAYLNLFFTACAFQMLGFYSEVAPRVSFYFVISLCVLLPDVIEKIELHKISVILETGSTLCFLLFGLYNLYTTDWAMAVPYHWFWESLVP